MSAHTPAPTNSPLGPAWATINLEALIAFSAAMDVRLHELERRFGARERELQIDSRHGWKALPKKPR